MSANLKILSMSKLVEIIEGWKNLATGNGFNIAEAQRRAELCVQCPFISHLTAMSNVPSCGKCGCVLAAKTRSMKSSCPIGTWGPYEDKS